MTIDFNCPNCDELIAFDSKHAGKRARCLSCGQLFTIPYKSREKAEKIKPEKKEKTDPLPGFYNAVFIESSKIFFNPKNATSLVFVIAAVCFKFFLAPAMCCGHITFFLVWGWLLGFYLNIIYETAFGIDELPEIYPGTSITFLWNAIRPFLIFLYTMFIMQLPFIITLSLLQDKGITLLNLWQNTTGLGRLLQTLHIVGLFFFPIAILTTAVGRDFTMLFRPGYILLPVLKAFFPYIVASALLVAACLLEYRTTQFQGSSFLETAAQLALNLAVQVVAIIAMRSIGLFARHFACHLPW